MMRHPVKTSAEEMIPYNQPLLQAVAASIQAAKTVR